MKAEKSPMSSEKDLETEMIGALAMYTGLPESRFHMATPRRRDRIAHLFGRHLWMEKLEWDTENGSIKRLGVACLLCRT